ncbi:DUF6232 family protein [Streptomyces sp. NPDC048340]|uniref:DUF6232 family protein n=1 Tax=Streptomyces sp. NPDC048340 TaxID=3365537 RepID=UPI00370FB043
MARHEIIDVRVSRRVLWIGAEAYPLNNIARATTVRIDADRKAAVGRFASAIVALAVVTVIAQWAIQEGLTGDYEQVSGRVAVLVLLALALVAIGRLVVALVRRTFYALVIETAGSPRTALVSIDRAEVHDLVHRIMESIDNPHADFELKIDNYIGHVGDNVNVFGGRGNTGKVGR